MTSERKKFFIRTSANIFLKTRHLDTRANLFQPPKTFTSNPRFDNPWLWHVTPHFSENPWLCESFRLLQKSITSTRQFDTSRNPSLRHINSTSPKVRHCDTSGFLTCRIDDFLLGSKWRIEVTDSWTCRSDWFSTKWPFEVKDFGAEKEWL